MRRAKGFSRGAGMPIESNHKYKTGLNGPLAFMPG